MLSESERWFCYQRVREMVGVISRAREVVVLSVERERWLCYQRVREVVVLSVERERWLCYQ